jgi:alcohol dehydrogenase, propanol-preferring
MTSYRVIQVSSDGKLEAAERELVDPPAGQVRLRVEACGVCHSDAYSVQPHPDTEPGRVPGHEFVGRIDALGAGVSGWAIGDRVGVGFLGGPCGVCAPCRRGALSFCTDQPWTGMSVDGGYAEVAYARASGLAAIPQALSSPEAAPLLCAGLATFTALLKGAPRPGDLVAVQGLGGVGHLGIQYARKLGVRVAAITRGPEKAELAAELGAQHYIDSVAADVGAELQKLGGAHVIVATGAGGTMSPLIAGLAVGGKLVVVGGAEEPIAVTALDLIFRDVQILGSVTGTSGQNEDNLRFAAEHGIRAMIETVPLAEAPSAFDRMLGGAARFRMVLTTPTG